MPTKIEKLKIEKGDDKTIPKEGLEIDIKPYTVLIGENNSGKTNLVNAFRDQRAKEFNFIYFPAINVEVEKSDEASTSKKTSPFYKLLAEILKKEKLDLDEDITKPINEKLAKVSAQINKNISFINNKEAFLKLSDVLSEEAVIKNLIPLRIIDKYWKEAKEVTPGDIGQGTQRLIIFALLKYYSEQKEENEKLNFFIIEEPEIYLHPKLKQEFNKVLSIISQKENNQVFITTHDPYFVEMNVDEQDKKCIIAIQRSKKTGFTEKLDVKPNILPGISQREINYRVFDVCSDSFHNELYGYLKAKDKTNLYALVKTKSWIDDRDNKTYSVSLSHYIRNSIHHPENTLNVKFTLDELKQSIEGMVKLAQAIVKINKKKEGA